MAAKKPKVTRRKKPVIRNIKTNYMSVQETYTDGFVTLRLCGTDQEDITTLIQIPWSNIYGLVSGLHFQLEKHRSWLTEIAGLFKKE